MIFGCLTYLPHLHLCLNFDFIEFITVSAPFKDGEYGGIVSTKTFLFSTNFLTSQVLWIDALSSMKQNCWSLFFEFIFHALQKLIKKMDEYLNCISFLTCHYTIYMFFRYCECEIQVKAIQRCSNTSFIVFESPTPKFTPMVRNVKLINKNFISVIRGQKALNNRRLSIQPYLIWCLCFWWVRT